MNNYKKSNYVLFDFHYNLFITWVADLVEVQDKRKKKNYTILGLPFFEIHNPGHCYYPPLSTKQK